MPNKIYDVCFKDVEGHPTDPLPKQLAFFSFRKKFGLFGGGFGAGKTQTLVYDAIQKALNPKYAGMTLALFRSTVRQLEATTMREFFKILGVTPENGADCPLIKFWNKQKGHGKFTNGSEFYFISFETGKLSFDCGYIGFDELSEFTQDQFLMVIGRLRQVRAPRIFRAASNPNGHDWHWANFHPESPKRIKDSDFVFMNTDENPYLPPDYIKSLRETYPEPWVRRYLDGSYEEFEGLIYGDFRLGKDGHVVDFDQKEIPHWWFKIGTLDYGFRNPTAAYKCAIDGDGNLWVIEEHYIREWTPEQHAPTLRKWIDDGYLPIVCDPSMDKVESHGLSTLQDYQQNGVYLTKAPADIKVGIARLQMMFKQDKIKIHPSCTNLIWELQNYHWKQLTPNEMGVKNEPEEPAKVNDHACDAMKYLANYLHMTAQEEFTISDKERDMHMAAQRYAAQRGETISLHKDLTDKEREKYYRSLAGKANPKHPWAGN